MLNLPFGRGAIVAGGPIHVPSVEGRALEHYRMAVEDGVNAVTRRAYEIVDRHGTAGRG